MTHYIIILTETQGAVGYTFPFVWDGNLNVPRTLF